jgi:leucine-rich repeat transmembrane neuronal protein 1/2
MYNAGKGQDFVAVELVNGHVHYVLNLGYGIIAIKDNSPKSLSDNQVEKQDYACPTYIHT